MLHKQNETADILCQIQIKKGPHFENCQLQKFSKTF